MSNSDRLNNSQKNNMERSFSSDRRQIIQRSNINNHSNLRLSNEQVQRIRYEKHAWSSHHSNNQQQQCSQYSKNSRNQQKLGRINSKAQIKSLKPAAIQEKSAFQKIVECLVPQQLLIESQQKQAIKCPICQQQSNSRFLQFSEYCKHRFCYHCLKQYVGFKINGFQIIQCPFENCDTKLQLNSDIFLNVLSNSERENYQKILLNYQLLANPHIKLCTNENCKGRLDKMQIKQAIKKDSNFVIKCSSQCNLTYCHLCLQQSHGGTCDKDMVKFFQKNKKFRQCSRCKRVIQKSQGCTHMTCLCGYYFCYMCGQQLKGQHECKIPQNLNCLQIVRWDVEHQQLFYQSSILSFHRCLYFFALSDSQNSIIKVFYSLFYTIAIYPLTIIASVLALVIFFAILTLFLILVFFFLPLGQICGPTQYKLTSSLRENCGFGFMVMMMIIFYPIFVISIMFQIISGACREGAEQCNDIYIFFTEIGKGIRNVLMMPCLLCLGSQEEQVQRDKQNNPANLVKERQTIIQNNQRFQANNSFQIRHQEIIT